MEIGLRESKLGVFELAFKGDFSIHFDSSNITIEQSDKLRVVVIT